MSIQHDPVALARIYAAHDIGHGVWQMLDTAMISDSWTWEFSVAYKKRFGCEPPPGLSTLDESGRLEYDQAVYVQVHDEVHNAASNEMMTHAEWVTEDTPSFEPALEPAAAAALEAAFARADPA